MSIRIWFLIQQFLTRNELVERPPSDYIHCGTCRARVALVPDYIMPVQSGPGGMFNRAFNVEVSDDVNNHETLYENTIAKAYCVQCGTMLGWKFITVHQPDMYVREGRFFLNLYKLTFSDDEPLLRSNAEQDLCPNEENEDQDGDPNEQNTDQDGDANEQTADQDGDANEQNADQNGDSTDQDGDANEQTADQDGNTNEQTADQDGDATDQNADQNGDFTDQDGGTTDQDGDATDQDGDANKQNADQNGDFTDQDGGTTDQDGDANE